MNYKMILINEDKIPHDLKRYVARIKVYPEGKDPSYYYLKKTLKKSETTSIEAIISAILGYQGSSRGPGVPSKEFMVDWKNSSRNPEIELLEMNPKANQIGFWEQYHTTKHREEFPNDKVDSSKNCYNKNNANNGSKKYGVIPHKAMMEYIAIENLKKEICKYREIEKLKEKICEHREKKSTSFQKVFLSRDILKTIKEEDKLIQSRERVKNKSSVSLYSEEMLKLPTLEKHFNKLISYLPENPIIENERLQESSELPEIGDGNQSIFAFFKNNKHEEMSSIGVPYDWHKHISRTGKEKLGNWFNHPPKDAGDYASENDILRSIRNTIIANKEALLIKDSEYPNEEECSIPDMNSRLIDQCFDDQRLSDDKKEEYKKIVLKEYKKRKSNFAKRQQNVWDFSANALNPRHKDFQKDDYDAFQAIMKEIFEEFPEYKDHDKKVGEQKIKEDSVNHILKYMESSDGEMPERLLVVVWTSTTDSYYLHTEGAGKTKDMMTKKLLANNVKNFKNFELIILNPERNPEGDSYYVMPDYVSKGESNE